MIISLNLPDAKFKTGDIVSRPNRNNENVVFFLINKRIADGKWSIFDEGKPKTIIEVDYLCGREADFYEVAIQTGSIHDYENATSQIRPGTVLLIDRDELDEIGTKVDWTDKTIFSPDTKDNCVQRFKNWDEENSKWINLSSIVQ